LHLSGVHAGLTHGWVASAPSQAALDHVEEARRTGQGVRADRSDALAALTIRGRDCRLSERDLHAGSRTISHPWVCEVLSPGTMAHDRGAKLPLYARESVPYVWLIDPLARLLEVFRLEATRVVLEGTWRDAVGVRAAPFDAVEIDLGALWER
jgi:hypothetical protein